MAGLELESLKKAVSALRSLLTKCGDAQLMGGFDPIILEGIKAGVIQHFEITYELSGKFIKRWLETNVSPSIAEGVNRRELYRLAAENRLIADVDAWMRHHKARNLTSHTYDPKVAEEVYRAAFDFSHDAQRLLEALEARND